MLPKRSVSATIKKIICRLYGAEILHNIRAYRFQYLCPFFDDLHYKSSEFVNLASLCRGKMALPICGRSCCAEPLDQVTFNLT